MIHSCILLLLVYKLQAELHGYTLQLKFYYVTALCAVNMLPYKTESWFRTFFTLLRFIYLSEKADDISSIFVNIHSFTLNTF